MAFGPFPSRSNLPDTYTHYLRLLGVNDAHPVVELGGEGVTVTRTGEGAYKIVWADSPGVFVAMVATPGAATEADLKGYTVVRDTYDATTKSLAFVVYNSSFSAADIIANQYLDLAIVFAD